MKSLFKPHKRDEALERLVFGITEGAKNCTTVIKKISTLCQNPEKYPSPKELIDKWCDHLFTNYFHDFIEEWISQKTISIENEEKIVNAFFDYLVCLTPFFYENKTIISSDVKPKKYKWTTDDFKQLKIKLLERWFFSDASQQEMVTMFKKGLRMEQTVKQISACSKAKKTIWKRHEKINNIVSPSSLITVVHAAKPNYDHHVQTDLFLMYTSDFITRLPTIFKAFDDNYYETGTYLYKFFQWSNA
jgi:hypothetical protein